MKRLFYEYLTIIILAFGVAVFGSITSKASAFTSNGLENINDTLNLDNVNTVFDPGDSRASAGVLSLMQPLLIHRQAAF